MRHIPFKFCVDVSASDPGDDHKFPFIGVATTAAQDKVRERITSKAMESMASQIAQHPISLSLADSHQAAMVNPLSEVGVVPVAHVDGDRFTVEGYMLEEHPVYDTAKLWNFLVGRASRDKLSVAGKAGIEDRDWATDPSTGALIGNINEMKLDHVLWCREGSALNPDTSIQAKAHGEVDWVGAIFKAATDSLLDGLPDGELADEPAALRSEVDALVGLIAEKAVWSTAYINNLPDSAFFYIEPGGKKDSEGKTVPRTLRHFPYKDADGKVDLAHLRNAISRIPQAKLPQAVKDTAQAKARRMLARVSKAMDDGNVPGILIDVGEENSDMDATRILSAIQGLLNPAGVAKTEDPPAEVPAPDPSAPPEELPAPVAEVPAPVAAVADPGPDVSARLVAIEQAQESTLGVIGEIGEYIRGMTAPAPPAAAQPPAAPGPPATVEPPPAEQPEPGASPVASEPPPAAAASPPADPPADPPVDPAGAVPPAADPPADPPVDPAGEVVQATAEPPVSDIGQLINAVGELVDCTKQQADAIDALRKQVAEQDGRLTSVEKAAPTTLQPTYSGNPASEPQAGADGSPAAEATEYPLQEGYQKAFGDKAVI